MARQGRLNKLFTEHLPMAERLARAHCMKHRMGEFEAYRVAAIRGLWLASQRHDPSKDNTFATYAWRCITGQLLSFDCELDHMPRGARRRWAEWHGEKPLPRMFELKMDVEECDREPDGPLENCPAEIMEAACTIKSTRVIPAIERFHLMQDVKHHVKRISDWGIDRRKRGRSFAAERQERAYHGSRFYAGE